MAELYLDGTSWDHLALSCVAIHEGQLNAVTSTTHCKVVGKMIEHFHADLPCRPAHEDSCL